MAKDSDWVPTDNDMDTTRYKPSAAPKAKPTPAAKPRGYSPEEEKSMTSPRVQLSPEAAKIDREWVAATSPNSIPLERAADLAAVRLPTSIKNDYIEADAIVAGAQASYPSRYGSYSPQVRDQKIRAAVSSELAQHGIKLAPDSPDVRALAKASYAIVQEVAKTR